MTRKPLLVLTMVFLFVFSLQVACFAESPANLPHIKILATGGTIAGSGATSSTTIGYTAAVAPVDALISNVPELKKVANVSGEQISQIASENMTNEVWLKLAKRVNQLLAQNDVDGIVITHGTDTLEETAYFLNLVVKSEKPVVLVGSMRPPTAMSADGMLNLYRATILAGSKDAIGKGVMVMLNDTIHSGRDVTKTITDRVDTFKAPEIGPLGFFTGDKPVFYRAALRKHTTATEFDVMSLSDLPRVDIVYHYANNTGTAIEAIAQAGAKGIVHAGTGNGSIGKAEYPAVEAAQKQDIVIVRSARVGNGIVARNGEANDDKYNFVAGDNLNPQKARILLMLALTKTADPKLIQEMFWKY
ncbi:L-asparaginase [Anaerosporomusa subterranea]|uniref:asparaginase n=1 Tax=Anaerosporomusa subterranea TaxID=1794912 RepID=A0A154BW44_ANASB|nr:type II asparaginase [Anaerosporomusa subterranea]KYZ78137.1 L-asparaginase [Anaerosporomusa subterranea]